MNSENNWFDLIEKYLEGAANTAEKQEVERLLLQDQRFQEIYQKHILAHRIIEVGTGIHLKEGLQDLEKFRQRELSNRFLHIRLLAAATIGLIFLVLAGMWYGKHRYSDTYLVNHYMEAYPAVTNRSSGKNNQEWEKALGLYARGDYEAAIELFSTFAVQRNPYFTEAHFYLGNACLQSKDAAKAIESFSVILPLNDSRFGPATEWYLGLAFIAHEEEGKARKILTGIIPEPEHPYREKAQKLLHDLQSWWR